ncbi:MAG: hypothetical protein KDD35_09830, partial [Bdellovibrionales bacterium]|nr:hypothetical protein [Bdellovibrionales bacterium]
SKNAILPYRHFSFSLEIRKDSVRTGKIEGEISNLSRIHWLFHHDLILSFCFWWKPFRFFLKFRRYKILPIQNEI